MIFVYLQAKTKDVSEAEMKAVNRLKQLYQTADAQDLYIPFPRLFGEVTVLYVSAKTSMYLVGFGLLFSGENKVGKFRFAQRFHLQAIKEALVTLLFCCGSGYNLSGTKSNLMKKAKLDLLKRF
ncbi:hypothetical protein Pint_02615 [Pistacia integerrima]|uniref:Uncharacterized protein n=1 Tax=Pistacia integerrima TaxID=434235 RepID=A0ACC0ZI56_9ROSI|nr:hypothetical protein Pint_02615 [Pistacia integerrima]